MRKQILNQIKKYLTHIDKYVIVINVLKKSKGVWINYEYNS